MNTAITDHDGATWPVTGLWCATCGLPLHASSAAFGTHPGCDVEALTSEAQP